MVPLPTATRQYAKNDGEMSSKYYGLLRSTVDSSPIGVAAVADIIWPVGLSATTRGAVPFWHPVAGNGLLCLRHTRGRRSLHIERQDGIIEVRVLLGEGPEARGNPSP